MFFTKIGIVIAHLALWWGLLRVALGFYGAFATADMESNRAFASRYLSSATTGEAIGEGITYVLFAVALGILCEISTTTRKQNGEG